MSETIKLIRGNAAIDAAILTKDQAADGVISYYGCTIDKIAVIGDEVADLPLLTKEGFGLVGAPANAQQRVIDTVVALPHGYVSSKPVFDGFVDFYHRAEQRSIELIISDKDGILKDGDITWGTEFVQIALQMGIGTNPYIIVLTGSSLQQNQTFMRKYWLDERLGQNMSVVDYPYLILVESGAIHVNILTGETRNYVCDISPKLLGILKGEFEMQVREKLDMILPKMGLLWTDDYDDQRGKVYHVTDKQSMVTFNVPRAFLDGRPYRKSEEAEKFRDAVLNVMIDMAEKLSLPYELL